MKFKLLMPVFLFLFGFIYLFTSTSTVEANNSWGGYHWARTSNPFSLKLGDNLSSNWDPYLVTASTDWNLSSVLDTTIVSGLTTGRRCRPTSGRIEVCNSTYGKNGWLGIAQIWASGNHIAQGTTKMNDTYFNTSKYNTPAWKKLVVCQEIAHAFGLDHQDEIFDNPNLGTCMDYTNNPSGPPSNEHPNTHDFEELELIYSHLDSFTTVGQTVGQTAKAMAMDNAENPEAWGRQIKSKGKLALYERDFGGGHKVFTFIIYAE